MKGSNQKGFTYIEVMCAIVILMVGILAQLSAITLSMFRQRESEKQTTARQLASSTLESIFAARDLGNSGGISSFNTINNTNVNSAGIFLAGWNPIRENAGNDGIHGTADDACAINTACQVGSYTNNSAAMTDFERQIIITDISSGSSTVKKRRVEVNIRFYVGRLLRQQSTATIMADLPFYQ